MIVQGQKVQTIDVEVDPVKFITDLLDNWKVIRSLPYDAELIKSGDVYNWKTYERMGHTSDWVVFRTAHPEEIVSWKAFQEVIEVAQNFE